MTTAQPAPNRRILVIDDNRAIHRDFDKIFNANVNDAFLDADEAALFGRAATVSTRRKFEIDSAFQGQEGLAMVEKAIAEGRPYAMAFVDVRMPPGWDGVETISRIWSVNPDLQIVICTAYSDYSWDEMKTKLGDSDQLVILKKPFDSIEVLQLTAAMVEKWRLHQETRTHLQGLEATIAQRTEQLRLSEEKFRQIAENIQEVFWMTSADWSQILYVSPAYKKVWGRSCESLYVSPESRLEAIHPEDQPIFQVAAEKHLASFPEGIEYRIIRPDGSIRWIRERAYPICDASGTVIRVVGVAAEITGRKQAEQSQKLMEVQLRQAQKLEAIGQLAAGIAHEINTPTQYVGDNTRFLKDAFGSLSAVMHSHTELLAAARLNALTPEILGRAEATLKSSDLEYLSAQIPAAITETLEGVERITKIVRAMKEFSHPGGKEKKLSDLNKAIESTVTVARNEWKYCADLTLDLANDLPLVPCFLGEINQAILNLIVNASHAIQDVTKAAPGTKGKITIKTRRNADTVEVSVSDTGTGIPEANRAHIFEPFFTTKEVGKGTGQGLSVIYSSIVKKHDGTVHFETELGKGTTFIVRLPIAPKDMIAGHPGSVPLKHEPIATVAAGAM